MRSNGPCRNCARPRANVFLIGFLACLLGAGAVPAADEDGPLQASGPVTPYVIDVDLRDLPAPREWQPGDPIREIPRRFYPPPGTQQPTPVELEDVLAAQQMALGSLRLGGDGFTTPSRNFGGIGFTGAGVPDNIGDVGPNYIIEAVNGGGGSTIRVWDKGLPTPSVVTTFTLDTLGTGLCSNGIGDPVVIYDRNAGRWVLMEFVGGGNNLCVYVSQTSDPVTGGWHAYSFVPPSFPDYPKLGVWPTDANGGGGSYVVTANAGVATYAMERGPMLTGAAAQFLIFDLPNLSGFGFQTATPADIDGPDLPPSGAPAVIMRHRDTEAHGGSAAGDLLEMWHLDVDWQTTGNTTLTQTPSIDVVDFNSSLCGLTSFSCIDQPNSGTNLDPLREVIMNRLQYINHDNDFETLVGNFAVDVDGNDKAGIRWFELRRTGGAGNPWLLHQEGTYTIDGDSRWMGASSMDQSGNIALAYNVSSATTFPGLRYTGRRFDDAPGLMTMTETSIIEGSSPSGTNRYGDYSAMGLDPADDCTFWFVGEYNPATTWLSRWVSVGFDTCGCLLVPSSPTLNAADNGANQIDLNWDDADLDTVIEYEVRRSRSEGGPYETIAVVPDSSPGVAGGAGYAYMDLDVSGGLTYYYVVVASDGGACKSDATNESAAVAAGFCLLRPQFAGAEDAHIDISGTCGNVVDWSAGTPECGTSVLYNLYRSTDPAFTPGPGNLVAGGIPGTSSLDQNGLSGGTEYFYTVRALDTANLVEDVNDVKVSVVSGGSGGDETFYLEDFENAATFSDWTVTTGPGNHRCGEWELSTSTSQRPTAGSGQYALALSQDCALLSLTSASLDSPVLDLSSPTVAAAYLEFDIYYNHYNGDDATVEVWDGGQWVTLWSDGNSDLNTTLSFNVSTWAVGNAAFQVRFNLQNANNDRWYSVDNVRIGVDLNCATAPAPNPAPGGAAGTTPLRGDRLTVAGDEIQVGWDATSCGAGPFNLIYGDLANVAGYALLGSECGLGGTGSYTWTGVPAGNLFFLVVGEDGAGTESSWGESTFGERNGLLPSGECAVTAKTVTGSCP